LKFKFEQNEQLQTPDLSSVFSADYIKMDKRKREGDTPSNFTRIDWKVFRDRQVRRSTRKLESNIKRSDMKYKYLQ